MIHTSFSFLLFQFYCLFNNSFFKKSVLLEKNDKLFIRNHPEKVQLMNCLFSMFHLSLSLLLLQNCYLFDTRGIIYNFSVHPLSLSSQPRFKLVKLQLSFNASLIALTPSIPILFTISFFHLVLVDIMFLISIHEVTR